MEFSFSSAIVVFRFSLSVFFFSPLPPFSLPSLFSPAAAAQAKRCGQKTLKTVVRFVRSRL